MKRFLDIFAVVPLAAAVLMDADFEAEWLTVSNLLYLLLLFAAIGFVWHAYRGDALDLAFVSTLLVPYVLSCLLLIGLILTLNESGFPEPGRALKFGIVYLLSLFVVAANAEPIESLKRTVGYVLAFAIVLGAFFTHLPEIAVGSGLVGFAVRSGLLMGLCMFIFPRYVSRDAFLWTVGVISAVVIAISLPVYVLGEYTLFGLSFELWGTRKMLPLVGVKFQLLESMFGNPNTMGGLAFAGTVGAAMAAHRSYINGSIPGVWLLPAGLFFLNGFGLYLSYSRAAWLAATVTLSLYGFYVLFGRNTVPIGFTAIVGGVVLLFAAMFLSIVEISTSGRFTLWGAGFRAIVDNPSLFGAGIIDPAEPLEPYLQGRYSGFSPHNSYVSIFLRAGLLGGLAYLVLTVGSVLYGAYIKSEVDVSMLAFATGFGIHHMFEAYTLYQYEFAAVCGAIVFGYLVLDGSPPLDEVPTASALSSKLRGARNVNLSRGNRL
ncbi:O-antigen ligase family protein [Halegenticoccus tardaugens]|uniref:O-antigen ligase family protein n=1 Tax=Halegenticoccus tardaugens TaxID=2071624 RepID=UPI00100A23EF|nr:O-antigen ligase family protein [Halegenticoccus tardaugens]